MEKGRKRYTGRKTFKDFYLDYKHRYDARSNKYVDAKEYTKILTCFFDLVSDAIINEAYAYKLPHKLGIIRIKKFKARTPAIDWHKTNAYKEKYGIDKHIYFTNNHSHGYAARWYWDKRAVKIRNKGLYKFQPTRTNKRDLAKIIKEENTIKKYFE